jgi:hypothetical protein
MKQKQAWAVSDISQPVSRFNLIEFQDSRGEWQAFGCVTTREKIVFGCSCNCGFIESGFIIREDGETENETFQELLSDLETYYNDGPEYVSRIVCNERM